MNRLLNKIKTSAGETLSETLVAILIIGVVSGGFASLIGVSHNLNRQSADSDAALYNQISEVELHSNVEADEGDIITFTMGSYSGEVNVNYYSSDDKKMYAYGSKDD